MPSKILSAGNVQKHAVYENQRTIHAVEALKIMTSPTFGKLINESHVSLRDDYETFLQGDRIFWLSLHGAVPGVYGSRITGGGFGGCTVSIVKMIPSTSLSNLLAILTKEKTGHTLQSFYVVDIETVHALLTDNY